MIKSIIIVNNQGKVRLTKFYTHLTVDAQQQIIREVYTAVSRRSERACNFVDVSPALSSSYEAWGADTKLIYRHYATLFFIFVVDGSESELGILDLIQVVVETFDRCFVNVCELDLVFHMDKIHYIIDEIIQGGLVLETHPQPIMAALAEQKNATDRVDGSAAPHNLAMDSATRVKM